MKIVSLEVENLMRVQAIEMQPDGALVVVGGKNGQGKTSLLNAIEYALGGTRNVCDNPVRDGEDDARIVLDLDDLQVTRTFKKGGGGSLVVRGSEGEKLSSPQTLLSRLTNRLTFDPLAFMRLGREDQTKLLLQLIGVDFSDLDKRKERLTTERRDTGRDIRQKQAWITAQKTRTSERAEEHGYTFDSLPRETISSHDITREHDAAMAKNKENERFREQYAVVKSEYRAAQDEEDQLKQEISSLEQQIENKKKLLVEVSEKKAGLIETGVRMKKQREELEDVDLTEIVQRLESCASLNGVIRVANDIREAEVSLAALQKEHESLDLQLKDIPREKAEMIDSAGLPIPELSFDDGVVTYKGQPFDQCGTAEQIRVSVAMGVAMNPELRVFLIRRDGSLLDEDNLALLGQLAEENNAQVWIERVSRGEECQVIIEDGRILGKTKLP